MTASLLELIDEITDSELVLDERGDYAVRLTYRVDPKYLNWFIKRMKRNYTYTPNVAPMCEALGCHYSGSNECQVLTKRSTHCIDFSHLVLNEFNVYGHSLYLIIKTKLKRYEEI